LKNEYRYGRPRQGKRKDKGNKTYKKAKKQQNKTTYYMRE